MLIITKLYSSDFGFMNKNSLGDGRSKTEDGRRKTEEGKRKTEDGRRKRRILTNYHIEVLTLSVLINFRISLTFTFGIVIERW